MWCKELNADRSQFFSQWIAVIGLVTDHAPWPEVRVCLRCGNELLDQRFDESRFSDRSRSIDSSQRDSLAGDKDLRFRALPTLCEANGVAPFFAARKVASMSACSHSMRFRWSSIPRTASHARRHTPCSSHPFSRRQQVTPL